VSCIVLKRGSQWTESLSFPEPAHFLSFPSFHFLNRLTGVKEPPCTLPPVPVLADGGAAGQLARVVWFLIVDLLVTLPLSCIYFARRADSSVFKRCVWDDVGLLT
jgi:hypothetical protein